MSLRHAVIVALLLQPFGPAAIAAPADNWPEVGVYDLGQNGMRPSLTPVMVLIDGISDDITVVGQRRAPRAGAGLPDFATPQAAFGLNDVGTSRLTDCGDDYTTVAGQPATAADLAERIGVRGCSF